MAGEQYSIALDMERKIRQSERAVKEMLEGKMVTVLLSHVRIKLTK